MKMLDVTQFTDYGLDLILFEEGMTLPDDRDYYLLSGDGLWFHKKRNLFSSFEKVKTIDCLPDLGDKGANKINWHVGKLSSEQVQKIKIFFQSVVSKHYAESIVLIFYNISEGTFSVTVPEQFVSHGGIRYQNISNSSLDSDDLIFAGTIHSHCDFQAFHSSTDIGDEVDTDGLHITFGNNDSEHFTITACLVVNGNRQVVDPLDFLEGLIFDSVADRYSLRDQTVESSSFVNEWLKKVSSHRTTSEYYD